MAYTHIHPIKTTLGKAIDYITDPLKTENQLYVHAENCVLKYAEKEFLRTQKNLNSNVENLAFHLIQSFPKGEVTAEQAMEIGRETMEKFLKGQYEFVIATHVNTDCIHNHIIINSVNMTNGKSFSTEHDRKAYPALIQVRQISDQILKEKGLSVIENPLNMSVSHYEWQLQKAGVSWKDRLKKVIDETIRNSDDFNSFLSNMREQNIEVKYGEYKTKSGKFLGLKMQGQKHFIYSKSFGWYYQEENIKKRIQRAVERREMTRFERRKDNILHDSGKLKSLHNLSDFEGNEGLMKWAKRQNNKITMQTLNELKAKGFEYIKGFNHVEDFFEEYNNISDKITENKTKLVNIENALAYYGRILKYTQMYREYKPVYDRYKQVINQEVFFRRHEDEILLFKEASEELLKTEKIVPNIAKVKNKIKDLESQKQNVLDENKALNAKHNEYKTLNDNLEIIFNIKHENDMPENEKAEKNEAEKNEKESKKLRNEHDDISI